MTTKKISLSDLTQSARDYVRDATSYKATEQTDTDSLALLRRNYAVRRKTTRKRRRVPGQKSRKRTGAPASSSWRDITLGQIGKGVGWAAAAWNVEVKTFDTSITATAVAAGTVAGLSLITQGSDAQNRDGISIRMQSISGRYTVKRTAADVTAALNPAISVRVIIVRDMAQSGTIPTVANILESALPEDNLQNLNVPSRFHVLHDNLFTLCSAGESGRSFDFFVPHTGHIDYIGTDATQGSQGIGNIYVLRISEITTNAPLFQFNSRISFVDN